MNKQFLFFILEFICFFGSGLFFGVQISEQWYNTEPKTYNEKPITEIQIDSVVSRTISQPDSLLQSDADSLRYYIETHAQHY